MTDLLLTLKGFCSRSPLPHPLPIAHLAGLGGKAESLLAFRVLPSRLAFEAGGLAFCMAGAHGSPRLIGHFPALEFRGARVGSANFGFGLIGMLPAQKRMGVVFEPRNLPLRHLGNVFRRALKSTPLYPGADGGEAGSALQRMGKFFKASRALVKSVGLKTVILQNHGGLGHAGAIPRDGAGHLLYGVAPLHPRSLCGFMGVKAAPQIRCAADIEPATSQMLSPVNCKHAKRHIGYPGACQ